MLRHDVKDPENRGAAVIVPPADFSWEALKSFQKISSPFSTHKKNWGGWQGGSAFGPTDRVS
jgi:hypothetical protein